MKTMTGGAGIAFVLLAACSGSGEQSKLTDDGAPGSGASTSPGATGRGGAGGGSQAGPFGGGTFSGGGAGGNGGGNASSADAAAGGLDAAIAPKTGDGVGGAKGSDGAGTDAARMMEPGKPSPDSGVGGAPAVSDGRADTGSDGTRAEAGACLPRTTACQNTQDCCAGLTCRQTDNGLQCR